MIELREQRTIISDQSQWPVWWKCRSSIHPKMTFI